MDWCNWVPLKCNIFVWRAEMDRIATVEALAKRGVLISDDMCFHCRSGPDSVDHLLVGCELALGLWEKISFWCRVQNFFAFSVRDLLEMSNYCNKGATEKAALQGIVVIACWFLWVARNNHRFSGKRCCVDDIFSEVRSTSFLWFKQRSKFGEIVWLDWCKFVFM
ncbi:putative reverse transcriptase zinc-binding domain-containing protein [Helianthus annuus]|uniref:Reverse transcriptase zinc-binding domain-containing protein n=1 Tax=Helianthus annuus TaxID=4232 RepID=A0A9K3DJK8_HELAN|nr:putative reverse transcriptase zinc-binding domain-containing protein [Helianthus annuus]KAJ0814221.1 putative reverse transcriptase zinc-binding domain-containing protein [Helianthus annuus]KAJ0827431.1 putative reverse transcriptase zinc-binding domain-containing protein [Helianthus annuus]